jgi:hypothetical protein
MRKQDKPGRLTKLIGTVLVFLLLVPAAWKAQTKQNEVVFSIGGALSFTQFGLNSLVGYSNQGTISRWSYPAFVLNGDVGLSDRISLGACFSWQTLGFNFSDVPYPNNNYTYYGNTPSPQQSWTDTYQRFNVSARGLYHFVRQKDWDLYLGVRIGYTWWDRNSNNTDPLYDYSKADEYKSILPMPVAIQSLFGMRYFFSDYFGINGEVGVGAPYALMLGVNVKFNN